MKKVCALLLALILAVSLAACGDNSGSDGEKKDDTSVNNISIAAETTIETTVETKSLESLVMGPGAWNLTSGDNPPYGIIWIEFYDGEGKAGTDDGFYHINWEVSGDDVIVTDSDSDSFTIRFKYEDNSLVTVDSNKTIYTPSN